MTKLWPIEDFRKFKIQPEIQIQPEIDWAGKFPAQPQVDWGVDLPQPRSTAQSTWVSTWGSTSLVGHVCLVHLFAPLGLFSWPVTGFDGSDLN